MEEYYYSAHQNKHFKLSEEKGRVTLSWVAVYKKDCGGFFHGWGVDVLESIDLGKKLMQETAEPSSIEKYITAMKDYFAIDKKVRLQFIEKYKL
ncbi:hypothetical protein [Belliella pelovolcani]|uniref:hypothetical protein n=1 Tax=Belliella pelovolcani TaxID=529505 RepID=UPI00391CDED9